MNHLPHAINNVGVIIAFTILAIAFQKWWLVLFAALFIATDSGKEG